MGSMRKKFSQFVRLFSAAKSESFWSAWSKSVTTVDQAIHQDWETLVARSREQYANNSYVKRYVNLCKTNIVGENGVAVQSTVKDRNGNADLPVQQLIERAWARFSQSVTTCGMSRAEFEQAVAQGCAIDGEVFIQPLVSNGYDWGVKFQFIDPILCPATYHDPAKNIRHGIEYAQDGTPVAYYFADAPTKHNPYISYQSQWEKLKRIPAEQIWHVYEPEWIGQKRGIPWVATVLGTLRDVDGYIHAAIVNARVGATKMGFFETTGNGEYVGEQNANGDMIMDAEAGSFEVLPEGLKLAQWNPDYPHQQFGEFVNSQARVIASGLNVAHHALTGDMTGVNYSSARIAALDERDGWKRKQTWLINRVTRPMFEMFVSYASDMGKINFNGRPLREQPEFYHQATYQGRRWQWVDPAKELTAYEKAVALGVKSRSDIIREQGKDPDEVWAEIEREKAVIDKLFPMPDNTTNEIVEVQNATNNQ